ncbi:hypothetical protein V6Z11_A08G106100 [Gossypium hirsutum]
MFLFEGISIPQTVCVAHFLLPIPLIFEFLGDPVTNPLSSSNFYPFGPSERWVQPPMEFLPSKRSRSCILSPMQPPRAPLHLLHAFLMTVIESPSTITSPNPISSTKTTPLRHAYASTVVESQTFFTGYHFHLLENLFRKITFLEDMVD